MKLFIRMVRFITPVVALTATALPVHSFNLPLGASRALLDAVAALKTSSMPSRVMTGADYAISKFDKSIVKAFEKAWERSGDGSTPLEGVVLILRMADG